MLITSVRSALRSGVSKEALHKPRRTRRGLGMFEVVLGLFVTSAVIAGVIEFIVQDQLDELNQSSAREISIVADAAEAFALSNFDQVVALIDAEADNIAEIDPAVLQAAGLLNTDTPITAFKDPIAVLFISDDPGVITAFAVARRAAGFDNSYKIPRPETGIRAVGISPRFRGATIIGYGLEVRIQNGQRSLVADANVRNGSMAGVRTISFATDIDPYLHRVAVPGRPELNRMETDLDMAGRSIIGIDLLASTSINTGTIDVTNDVNTSAANITGALTVDGATNITGALTGGDAAFTGRLDATTADINSELRTASVVADTITGDNATFTQSLSTDALTATVATTGDLSADTLTATNVTIQQITTDTVILTGALTANEGFINQITTGSCTGC